MENLQIILTGKVYKVGLCYFIKQMANHYGIIGTVRYQEDVTVAIDATGEKEKMDRFLSCCRLGCLGSDVKNVSIKKREPIIHKSFEIVE